MRLIDADALIEMIYSDCALFLDKTCDGKRISCYPNRIVRNAPTVDAVPVVRCKDCKGVYKESDYEYWCGRNGFPMRRVTAEDYCSRGQRKEQTE